MCVKQLPKKLNPHAQEWRPCPAPPPQIPPLPHALFTYPQPLYGSPPPLQYNVSLSFAPTENIYPRHRTISEHQNLENMQEAAIDQRPKKGLKKKYLPPRLRKALKSRTHPPPPPPPPPPQPKLEWRPKNAPQADFKYSGASSSSEKTTLMIKNIPNQLRRDFMLKFLDGLCKTHYVAYDFFYLPFDFRRLGNLGYAFVNFTTPTAAKMVKKILSRYKWQGTYTDEGECLSSNKVCDMKWARIQGKEGLLRRFEKATFVCDDEEFLPVLLDPPRDGSDPDPPAPVNVGSICRRSG